MNKPNLFKFATSELSQDAFICWLLNWAYPEFKNIDKELHGCGINLINAFFEKHSKQVLVNIDKIEIKKQDKQIDVLCIINNKYAIIIEDKTNIINHSEQLNKYYNDVSQRGKFKSENILPIYFKTGDQSDSKNKEIEKKKYEVFQRNDFLNILKTYKGSNQIFLDYREYLQKIEDKVNSFEATTKDQWGWEAFTGYYKKLQQHLNKPDWGYVANPRGGHFGLWWNFQNKEECQLYLQLEHNPDININRLCVKIEVVEKNNRALLRDKWHNLVLSKAKELNLSLVKPKRFGSGTWMTVCVYEGEYRVFKGDKIDILATVDRLKDVEVFLNSVG